MTIDQFPRDKLDTHSHDIPDRHQFGESFQAPIDPADIALTASVGSASMPARADHVHSGSTLIDGLGGGSLFFGSGLDGAAVFDGTNTFSFASKSGNDYTLTRDIFCTTIVISGSATVALAGWRMFASTSITCNVASGITVKGGNASGSTAGAVGGGSSSTILLGGAVGRAGVAAGAGGSAGNSTTPVIGAGNGGAGGTGNGGANAGGAAGTTTAVTAVNGGVYFIYSFGTAFWGKDIGGNKFNGGASGGSGGGGTAGNSGGSGGGGGVALICSPTISGTGSITAAGGNGGNAPGTNAGGGGGGGGGTLLLYTTTATTITTSVAGGTAGAKTGTGVAGSAGSAGTVYNIVVI